MNVPFSNQKEKLKSIILLGFLLRLGFLIVILLIAKGTIEPYFITDDISLERNVLYYINNASSLIDFNTFNSLRLFHQYPFWSFTCCVFGFVFRTSRIARFLNIFLSTGCIYLIYRLCFVISRNEDTALRASKCFAFLPYPIFACCFSIKDVFVTFSVLYILLFLLNVINHEKFKVRSVVFALLLACAVRFTRGAVIETILLSFAIMLIGKLIKDKKFLQSLIIFLICLVFIFVFRNYFISAFTEKIDNYSDTVIGGSTTAGIIKIRSIKDIYKLPFTVLFASLQPMATNIFNLSGTNRFWLHLLSVLNISIYPIAFGNIIYIFRRKKNFLFWLSTGILYCAVIILSLGVFRHYMFLLPIIIINYSLYSENRIEVNYNIGIENLLSFFLFVFVMFYSLLFI